MTVNEKGYAKLNYSLDVHARRPDGYHDLTMVMGSVSLWDDVDVTLRRDGRIEAKCSIPWLPRDERNLAVRAARVFFDAAGDKTLGADIRIIDEPDGTERALTEEELLADINCPEVTYRDDGTVTVYYLDQKLDVTDKFDEDGVCYVQLEGGEKTIYMTIKRGNGYATSTTKYILPSEFNN